ncbi:murein L,D-transpeptidase, partial [Clostridioides difficile]|nr:murein L,D-transpeptidase [Clostridioides difficile]
MRSSRAASLVAALVMSLSAGVVGVANAEPTASPNPR